MNSIQSMDNQNHYMVIDGKAVLVFTEQEIDYLVEEFA